MINITGDTLTQKITIVAREIIRNSKLAWIKQLANQLKTPSAILSYVKAHVRYRHDPKGDVLYEPDESLKYGCGDCEDYACLVGSLLKAAGYKVALRIVKNSVDHIYSLVFMNGRWIPVDPTPHRGLSDKYINDHFHVVLQGEITNDPNNPIEFVRNDEIGKFIESEAKSIIKKIVLSAIGLSALSGFIDISSTTNKVEVDSNYIPKAGDKLLYYFKPKWYLPDSFEKWILEKAIEYKINNCKILRAYWTQLNGQRRLAIEVQYLGSNKDLGFIGMITAGVIALSMLGLGLAAYFTIDKIYKIIQMPKLNIALKVIPVALLIMSATGFLGKVNKFEKYEHEK